jgi:hypothetical protein
VGRLKEWTDKEAAWQGGDLDKGPGVCRAGRVAKYVPLYPMENKKPGKKEKTKEENP